MIDICIVDCFVFEYLRICLVELFNIYNCFGYIWIGLVEVFLFIICLLEIIVFFEEVVLEYMNLILVNFLLFILVR